MRNVEEDIFIVYRHTNMINGKIYIGITALLPENRWRNGNGYYSNKHFYDDIQKYGWNSFKHEVLFSNLTKEEACEIEIKLIAFYKSNDEDFGYNGSSGGEHGHLGCKHSEETKRKMRENHADLSGANSKQSLKIICLDTEDVFNSIGEAGRKLNIDHIGISNVLKHKTKSTHGLHFEYLSKYDPNRKYDLSVGCNELSIQKMKQKLKGRTPWNKGKKHSKESIEKMRLAKVGKKASLKTKAKMSETQKHIGCKRVICIETGQVFESISECARQLNLSFSNIASVCRKERKSTGNLHFEYIKENKNED